MQLWKKLPTELDADSGDISYRYKYLNVSMTVTKHLYNNTFTIRLYDVDENLFKNPSPGYPGNKNVSEIVFEIGHRDKNEVDQFFDKVSHYYPMINIKDEIYEFINFKAKSLSSYAAKKLAENPTFFDSNKVPQDAQEQVNTAKQFVPKKDGKK